MSINKPIIICVDDEKFVLDTLVSQLQKKFGNKYEYESAQGPQEAIDLIYDLAEEGAKVVMVISDQLMPGMTGDQFLAHVHKNHPLPIKILLTGQASLESAISAINNANLYRYIAKPWDQEDFLLTVEKGMEQYNLLEETTKQANTFKKFVPHQFIETLGVKSLTDIKLGAHIQRAMGVFFSDIRGFTTISEKLLPEEVFTFINDYLKYIEFAIQRNNGFVDKFIGDAVMALFPTTEELVHAAIDTQRSVKKFNMDTQGSKYEKIKCGIGLHFGELILGIVGVKSRMQGTVISDAVNLASRLQTLSSKTGSNIIVSEEVINRIILLPLVDQASNIKKHVLLPGYSSVSLKPVGDDEKPGSTDIYYRLLGQVIVRGKSELITIYEILDTQSDICAENKIMTIEDFESGLKLFLDKKFPEACILFKKVITTDPNDKVAELYLNRAAYYIVHGTPADWNGAEI